MKLRGVRKEGQGLRGAPVHQQVFVADDVLVILVDLQRVGGLRRVRGKGAAARLARARPKSERQTLVCTNCRMPCSRVSRRLALSRQQSSSSVRQPTS